MKQPGQLLGFIRERAITINPTCALCKCKAEVDKVRSAKWPCVCAAALFGHIASLCLSFSAEHINKTPHVWLDSLLLPKPIRRIFDTFIHPSIACISVCIWPIREPGGTHTSVCVCVSLLEPVATKQPDYIHLPST